MKTLLLVFLPAAALICDQAPFAASAPKSSSAPKFSEQVPAAEKAPATASPARPDVKRNSRERPSRPAHLFM